MFPYSELVIDAETVEAIPPPYAHSYSIVVAENPGFLTLSFKLTYTQREELSEEEILDEGFSLDDDFSWRGNLNKVWKDQLDEILKASQWVEKLPRKGDYSVKITSKHRDKVTTAYVSGKEVPRWAYFIQEIRQAILESEQIEAPLTLEYLQIAKGRATPVILKGSFSDRIFSVRVDDKPIELFDWSVLQRTVNLIFNETEIDPEKSSVKRPTRDGSYLMIPGTGWLELSVGLKSRYDDDRIIEKIESTMQSFIKGDRH